MAFLCPQPSAPATPDYAAAATAQGTANKETALLQGYLNNPNIKGPLGGQTVTFDPVTNQPTITQNLTGTAQSTLEAQQRVQRDMANLGEKGLATASNVISKPFQYTGPAGIFSLADSGKIAGAPDLTKMGKAEGSMFGFGGTAQGMGSGGTATGNVTGGQALGTVANPQATANFQGGQAVGGVTGPTLQQTYGNYGTVQGGPDLSAYGSASSISQGAARPGCPRGAVAD